MANTGTPTVVNSKLVAGASKDSFDSMSFPSPIYLGEVIDVEYGSGEIKIRTGKGNNNVRPEDISTTAIPLLSNLRIYPVLGELVLVIELGNKYYLPLNVLNSISSNRIATRFSDSLAQQKYDDDQLLPKTFDINTTAFGSRMLEGDITFLGRFGQSIKFGSTVKTSDGKGILNYSKSEISENGDPIVIIRNDSAGTEENIVQDGSSIYMCSTQRILIDTNNNGFEGMTDAWSTINVNSTDYTATLIQSDNLPVEDEEQLFQETGTGQPGPSTTYSGQAPSTTLTPATATKESLVKLTGFYYEYIEGLKQGAPVELYVVDGCPVSSKYVDSILKLKRAANSEGVTITLTSGFRANENIVMPDNTIKSGQNVLYAKYLAGGNKAAKPGFSHHQRGFAFDVLIDSTATYKWLVRNALKYGFVRTVQSERWHWEYIPEANSIYYAVSKTDSSWDGFNDGME